MKEAEWWGRKQMQSELLKLAQDNHLFALESVVMGMGKDPAPEVLRMWKAGLN